ncbi:MAG: aldose epimerase family protein [Candidatus Limnocylindrales bacterium]
MTVVLDAGDARLTIRATDGGRFGSLVIAGHEVLVTEGWGPIRWGCYPMAPFAGRIRDGRFNFRGRDVRLPLNLPPHAIHGTVFERPWQIASSMTDRATLTCDLGPDWPFAGRVTQSVTLHPDGLDATLALEADEPMPVSLGWHPWFRRALGSAAIELGFAPGRMYERGADGLPTGALVPPRARPWDDAFIEIAAAPHVRWPGILDIELTSSADVWVVYDETTDGLCVEPQTAPPDAVNLAGATGREPAIAEPGRPVTMTMGWRWRRLDAPPGRPG